MAEKDQISKEQFTHDGLMDFRGFYSFAHRWLREEEYGVSEDKYSEKVSGNSKDITAEWKAVRKLSDYFKIEVKIEIRVWGLTDVEVTIDGQKKKMNKGRMEVKITGVLVKDWDSKWETSTFSRFMRDVYNKYIIPARVDAMEDKVRGEMIRLKEEIKGFLELTGKR